MLSLHDANGLIGIVVENIVYNCTGFIKEHPGGEQVVESFSGDECSRQVWRFHDSKQMDEFGSYYEWEEPTES